MSRHFGISAATLLVLLGCTAVDEPVTSSVPSVETAIGSLTAAHPHFFFLPPLGAVPSLDRRLRPGAGTDRQDLCPP